ncbi:unnamed protein product [Arabidopsis halleri]
MDLYNDIYGAVDFDVYDNDEEQSMAVLRAAMEECLAGFKRDLAGFKRDLHEEMEKMRQYLKDEAAVWGKTMKNSNGLANVEMVNDLQVSTKPQPLVTSSLKRSTTSPKRGRARTLPRRHHHTSPKRHRYGRKRKTTRTWKKMKKVSRAEKRKKRRGKKPISEVLVHWQGLSRTEATWKDAQAFLRTLRTRFFGGWSIDKIITKIKPEKTWSKSQREKKKCLVRSLELGDQSPRFHISTLLIMFLVFRIWYRSTLLSLYI